ncbi:hypothetical protein [Acidovorax sp. 106]|uniref:hypothetical protein n=1 Tax=Acidovorax sp. 106 TaxID=2135637 RepID=UPI000EADCDF6|nr:hypothetical protein [Acidovorax sp. 106]RLJ40250.1 hypothetical protein C8C98_4009 [Acidovorax sp. 106]
MTLPDTPSSDVHPVGAARALQLHDARPFFDKVLAHGVQHGIIDVQRLAAIHTDAPKGIVQIARYFGSEFLRPELEKARDRMVNLISLYLLDTTGGDLTKAAVSLRDNSLLSRSKGGSDMLKRLIAMPESSNFGMAGYDDAQTPLLAVWSLRSHAEYQAELARRSHIGQAIAAAQWLAEQYDLDADELEAAGADAEAVIRTGLLMQALAPQAMAMGEWPHTVAFEKLVNTLRKKKQPVPAALRLPTGLPAALRDAVQAQCQVVLADMPKLLDAAVPLRTLLRPTGVFRARYFLLDDPLAEVDGYHRSLDALEDGNEPPLPASKLWLKTTQGNEDEHSLLTLFVCLAAGAPKKTLLTEKTAASLVRKIRKSGWTPELAAQFIRDNAPGIYQSDYLTLWTGFVQDATKTLTSDMDYQMHDALALLRRECSVVG